MTKFQTIIDRVKTKTAILVAPAQIISEISSGGTRQNVAGIQLRRFFSLTVDPYHPYLSRIPSSPPHLLSAILVTGTSTISDISKILILLHSRATSSLSPSVRHQRSFRVIRVHTERLNESCQLVTSTSLQLTIRKIVAFKTKKTRLLISISID
jgi:hypothetical protein